MNKKEIAKKYISFLENGEVDKVVALFAENGIVDSPLYGIKKATKFYHDLNSDTLNSELILKGIFEENDADRLALYFTYIWTLRNHQKVKFDVVDIIDYNEQYKITTLKIIYDTAVARNLVKQLKG